MAGGDTLTACTLEVRNSFISDPSLVSVDSYFDWILSFLQLFSKYIDFPKMMPWELDGLKTIFCCFYNDLWLFEAREFRREACENVVVMFPDVLMLKG